MADVAVVTDSTASLPGALVASLDITVVPLYYDPSGSASPIGGHEVPGRGLRESEFDGDFGRFYAELDASKSVATTSPPTVDDFVEVFDPLLQQHGAVVAVLVSSNLSKTCSIARQATAQLESQGRGGDRVMVFDSAGVAGHLGVQAVGGARGGGAGG